MQRVFIFVAIGAFVFSLLSCSSDSPAKKESPAKVENPVTEAELTVVHLTPEAEQRLGIETALVGDEMRTVTMELGGEIIAPPGADVRIAAPSSGTVLFNDADRIVQVGAKVKQGQAIMRLVLMPPEKDLMGAREESAVKQIEFDVAKAKMDRAEKLLKDRAISEKVYQQTQAEFALASASFKAAQAKVNLLNGADMQGSADDLSTMVLEAPIDGIVQHLYVASGQTVPASTLLFSVAGQNPVWVRVPVYSGEVGRIDLQKNAVVTALGAVDENLSLNAKPIQGPRLSDPTSATSDLYYELDNSKGLFGVGMRVKVMLTKKSESTALVVPWSSIVYDIDGGAWVYVKIAEHRFARRRVEIVDIIDNVVTLRRGVSVGDEVVKTAVAELYGTEFGGGK